jgi:hypothetical protein
MENAPSSTCGSVKGMSIVVQKTPSDSSFAMKKLEAIGAENARLIQSQQDMKKNKCVVLHKKNKLQSSCIAQLERELQATEQRDHPCLLLLPPPPCRRLDQRPRDPFFGKFVLDSPSFGKAELVSQGLAVVSQSSSLRPEPSSAAAGGTNLTGGCRHGILVCCGHPREGQRHSSIPSNNSAERNGNSEPSDLCLGQ